MSAAPPPVTLFFDGACPVCSREARHYRRLLPADRLGLTDIAAPTFSAQGEGLDAAAVERTIHARLADGTVLTGVDAFAAVWREIPRYRWLATATRWPGVRQAMQLGYAAFARVRPKLPGRTACSPSRSATR